MRVLFAGTPEAALPVLQRLIDSEHEIVGVVTRPDAKTGRGRSVSPSPVALLAEEHHLPIIKSARINDPEVVDQLNGLQPDLAVIVAFGALIKDPLLHAWPWINLHFSLLPAYRGAAPVQHALLAGEEITGVTTFILDEGLDTGAILGQATERVRPEDTAGSLMERLSASGADLVIATLARWSELDPLAQTNENVSFAPKIGSENARINWRSNAVLIDRHIRAMTPKPGAWTQFNGQRFEVMATRTTTETLPAGVIDIDKHRVLVGSGSSALELITVKPQGKREMSALEWSRGLRNCEMTFE